MLFFVDDIQLIESTPVLRIEDGTQLNNYVLISDSLGNASWADGTVFGSPDDDWAFTSGSTNSDPVHRLGNVLIGSTGTPSFNLHIYIYIYIMA